MKGRDLLKAFPPPCLNVFIGLLHVNDVSFIPAIAPPLTCNTEGEKNNIFLLHFSLRRHRDGTQRETDGTDSREGEEEIYGNVLKIAPWYYSV